MLEGRTTLRTADQREFVQASWTGHNVSGITPLDDKVLVLMDEHAETTRGGIVIPDDARSQRSMASETGVIVALGDGAFVFSDDGMRRLIALKPKPGDRVVVERYAGRVVQGEDSVEYRLVSQKSIGALYHKTE